MLIALRKGVTHIFNKPNFLRYCTRLYCKDVYGSAAVRTPSAAQLLATAQKLNIDIDPSETNEYRDLMAMFLRGANTIEALKEPLPEVKYPRTCGHPPEDNPFNAWAWMTDIHGSSEGKLKEKTIAVKDNVAVAAVPMRNGSRILDGYVPEFDASIVTRILDEGGRIKGKAVNEDLCLSGSSFTTAGPAVTNPHDQTRSAGGSSCGSAALVAGGQVDMAIGGDQGGSIRMPSSWCGIVGLKPTWGLVPYTGISSIETTIDHVGPMARNVHDCGLLLEAIAGYDDGLDPRQPAGLTVPSSYTDQFSTTLPGIKIGVMEEGFGLPSSEADVDKMVKKAALHMSVIGAKVDMTSVPFHRYGQAIWGAIANDGIVQTMYHGFGVGGGFKGFYPTSMMNATSQGLKCRANDLAPTVKLFFLLGQYLRDHYGGRYHAKGHNLLRTLTQAYDDALKEFDVLVLPTMPFKAPKLPAETPSIKEYVVQALNMVANTAPFNTTGHPALTINTGFSEGLPVGMMLVGKHFDEKTILKVAYAYEKLRDKIANQ